MSRDHNAVQLAHYAGPGLVSPRMQPVDTPYVRRHVARLVDELGLAAGMRVLDVGCGLGKFTRLLHDHHQVEVEGLDLSPDLLARFRAERPDIPLHRGDLLRPPRELAGRFDAVTGFFVLHHLEDLTAAFAGIRTMLREGGRAAFVEPNAWCPLFWAQITCTPGMSWRAERGMLRMTRQRLTGALTAAGYVGASHRTSGLLPPVLANRPGALDHEDRVDELSWTAPVRAFAVVSATRPATG